MDRYSKLRDALRNVSGMQIFITSARVKEITGETCTVTIGKLDVSSVRLKATSVKSAGKLMITPRTGSVVLIGSLSGDLKDLAVLSVDEAEKVEISGDIVFNEGKNDGMVLVKELVKKLNTLENDINLLKQVFRTWVAVSQDGGSALSLAAATWAEQQLEETQQKDIENKSVKQ